jgi:CcmD family protein
MQGFSFLVIAYAVVWLALLGYLGWIALRMRGVRAELETVRELVEERERRNGATGGQH